MGISKGNWHRHCKTGGKGKPCHKRKCELGCPTASTKTGRIHAVRVRGGKKVARALRLDVGTSPGGLSAVRTKQGLLMWSTPNNELVHMETLVKSCIVLIDSTPCRQWYESHYALPLGRKNGAKLTPEEEEIVNKKRSKKIQKKYDERKRMPKSAVF